MVSACKIIIKIIILGIVFTHSMECTGQNTYKSSIYYNMDTVRCVDKDVRFWEGGMLKFYEGNPDSTGLYCTFKKNIEIPVVAINDDNVVHIIDSCIIDATKNDFFQFPDSSGFFIELHIFEVPEDSLMLGLAVAPYPNYYMAEVLSNYRNEVFYEWYGYKEKELHGCFFINNILCVISSQGWVDYTRASCLFPSTESRMTLALFSPIRMIVSNNTWSKCYYYFSNCDSGLAPSIKKVIDKNDDMFK